ncbi:MAG TPA: ATP-binding protein [Archangium sp.]|jgi:PAS domain S-box-containing protein|uniref:ATP-binding protein n=1 Tax=Archangium sp. TaxID=1872627 RepID=UPI002ED9113C
MTTASTQGMEPARSESELLLRVGSSLHAALVVDTEGRIVWMDGPLALASGWREKAPEGHASEEVLAPLPWLTQALRAAFSGEEAICEGDAWGRRMRALVLPVFGEGGGFLGTCTRLSLIAPVSESVDRREALEQELTQTQRQHVEFINNLDGIVWEADASFRFLFVSQQAERLLGYPVQQWMEELDFWKNHIHPEDREWACTFCTRATLECRPHQFEYRMLAADGRIVWLRDIVTVISEDERPLKLRGIMVDVTEQHRVREDLEQTISLLQATLDSTADGVLVADRSRKVTAFNQRFQELWGIPNALLDTRDDEQVLHSVLSQLREPDEFLARVLELYATPEAESSEIIELRDGRILERYSRPHRLGDTIIGRVWSFREVTQHVRAQQERERLLHEAREAIQVRDDFLSIASHELKTPLTPLKLHLQVLKKRVASGQPVPSHHLEKALAQLERLSVLISDLLDTSRIQAGRLDLKHEPLPLGELAREVLAELSPVSSSHTLTYEGPEEALVVLGDRGRLAQVLTNLLENALKYSPTGGTIRVTVQRDGPRALVSVSDEGIGIPPDQRLQLFERFFRARNAPISGFGGLGLGLYICRDIVEHHGGRIWVESEVGRGSTFRFTLPLASGDLRT